MIGKYLLITQITNQLHKLLINHENNLIFNCVTFSRSIFFISPCALHISQSGEYL